MQVVRTLLRASMQAWYGYQRIKRSIERHRVMHVRPCHRQGQRDALRVYDNVAHSAELSSVGRVRPRLMAPPGLATLALSILARLQSMRFCSHSLLSMA